MFETMVEWTMGKPVREVRKAPGLLIGDAQYKGAVHGPEDVLAAWPEPGTAERDVFDVLLLNARHGITRRAVVSFYSRDLL